MRLLLLAAILAGSVGTAPVSAGTSAAAPSILAKVYFSTEDQLNSLAAQLDVWEVYRDAGYVLALMPPAQVDSLRAAGWRVEAGQPPSVPAPAAPQTSGIPGFPCYRTLAETYSAMQTLAAQYPTLAQMLTIGPTWEKVTSGGSGGNDIQGLKITSSARPGPKPVFFLMAEIHARELTTGETALRFAEYLLKNYGVDPDVTWLLDEFEIQIVPMTNPDGRLMVEANLGSYWRKNTDNANGCASALYYGTDLNRNFSFNWDSGGSSADPCDETYMGPSAASEPEVQALQNYLDALFPGGSAPTGANPAPADTAGLLITLHSYASLVLWPNGYSPLPAPNATQLQTLGRKLAYFNDYVPEQSFDLYQTSGSTDDWLYGTHGIASYTFEMGTDFYQDCSEFETTIWSQNRDALLYAFKSVRRPYQTPAGPDILSISAPSAPVAAGYTVTFSASADATRSSTINGSEPQHILQAARASLDTPSWEAGAAPVALTAADGAFDSTVESVSGTLPTAGLAPGRHTLFIEAQDSAGDWGPPSAVFIDIARHEYWLALVKN